jgi:hypothetical protein
MRPREGKGALRAGLCVTNMRLGNAVSCTVVSLEQRRLRFRWDVQDISKYCLLRRLYDVDKAHPGFVGVPERREVRVLGVHAPTNRITNNPNSTSLAPTTSTLQGMHPFSTIP